jgi:hypothetical protein
MAKAPEEENSMPRANRNWRSTRSCSCSQETHNPVLRSKNMEQYKTQLGVVGGLNAALTARSSAVQMVECDHKIQSRTIAIKKRQIFSWFTLDRVIEAGDRGLRDHKKCTLCYP